MLLLHSDRKAPELITLFSEDTPYVKTEASQQGASEAMHSRQIGLPRQQCSSLLEPCCRELPTSIGLKRGPHQLVHDVSTSPLVASSWTRSLDMADGILCRLRTRDVASLAFWYFRTMTLSSSRSNLKFSSVQPSTRLHRCFRFSTSTPFTFFT